MVALLRATIRASRATRSLHTSSSRHAVTQFTMPAMSPTMTEGGIASWKKKEGEAFSTGDILLEIETDKATMDVEAQDDGIMGKILVQDGAKAVPVGKLIALLAEEGDDISNLVVPAEAESSSSKPAETSSEPSPPSPPPSGASSSTTTPSTGKIQDSHGEVGAHPHSKLPLFPSVIRLLQDHNLSADVDSLGIKGTGRRGMLTKGDVLAHLGLASNPNGTYKITPAVKEAKGDAPKKEPPKAPLTGDELRALIVAGMVKASQPVVTPMSDASFASIINDYLKPSTSLAAALPVVPPFSKPTSGSGYLDGLI